MTIFYKNQFKRILNLLPPQFICWLEFNRQSLTHFNERAIEYAFVFRCLQSLYPQKILDVGAGTTALPHLMSTCGCHVTATDNKKDYWPSGTYNRHFHVKNDDIADSKLTEKFDLITCISVLEHIQNHDDAMHNIFNLLNPQGHLILTFPYSENKYINNVYKLAGSNALGKKISYITQSFSKNELTNWLQNNHGKIIEQEYWQCWSGDYWTLGDQKIPPLKVSFEQKHQLTLLLIQKVSS
ncbi:MAG: class I SAM-dependent methyltransferase [Acholeplasmataceae bacterium]|nr:class I SAM-dependent methyltransferase [Acholeplasmataceae bacterium]